MKALFIGGTGTISTAIVRKLASDPAWEVWLINRGNRSDVVPSNVHLIKADVSEEEDVRTKIQGMHFDVVCEFIGFTVDQVERDYRLFKDITKQYIYISSASAYNKPAADYRITEGTTLSNPHWEYSRNKIASEEFLMKKYREEGFPVTIVRPSHTYDERNVPLGVHGKKGFYQVIKRMQEGRPVIIQGDGTSLWTVTFNEDFAIGFIGLYETIAEALGVKLNAYHISSEYLSAVGDKYGFDFEGSLIGDKAVSVVFDNSKIKRIVPQMRTNISFNEGVRISLQYVLTHPECQVEDPEFDAWCDKVIDAIEQSKKAI